MLHGRQSKKKRKIVEQVIFKFTKLYERRSHRWAGYKKPSTVEIALMTVLRMKWAVYPWNSTSLEVNKCAGSSSEEGVNEDEGCRTW